jgi:hypothetical protein
MKTIKYWKKKEIEEDTRRWKEHSCSWICSTNIVKMATLLKEIYIFNEISIKIPIFHKTRKKNPKVHIRVKRP